MFYFLRINNFYSTHNVNTRNKGMIQRVDQRLSMCQRTMSFPGSKEWSCLPIEIRCIKTIGNIKKLVKILLLDLYTYEWKLYLTAILSNSIQFVLFFSIMFFFSIMLVHQETLLTQFNANELDQLTNNNTIACFTPTTPSTSPKGGGQEVDWGCFGKHQTPLTSFRLCLRIE